MTNSMMIVVVTKTLGAGIRPSRLRLLQHLLVFWTIVVLTNGLTITGTRITVTTCNFRITFIWLGGEKLCMVVLTAVTDSTKLDTRIRFVVTIGSRLCVKATRVRLMRQSLVVGSTNVIPFIWLTTCLLSMSIIEVLARMMVSMSVQVLTCRQCRIQTTRQGRNIRAEAFRTVKVISA